MTTNTETMEQKNERNARVSARYDELMREGKHGHYETLFRVVREECDRVRAADREARPAPASRLTEDDWQAIANVAEGHVWASLRNAVDARIALAASTPPGEAHPCPLPTVSHEVWAERVACSQVAEAFISENGPGERRYAGNVISARILARTAGHRVLPPVAPPPANEARATGDLVRNTDDGKLYRKVDGEWVEARATGDAFPDLKWPDGYCLDPDGVMVRPVGAEPHWSFGYEIGYREAMATKMRALSDRSTGAAREAAGWVDTGPCVLCSGTGRCYTPSDLAPAAPSVAPAGVAALVDWLEAIEDPQREPPTPSWLDCDWRTRAGTIARVIRRLAATGAAGEPQPREGWKWVPVEPTTEMLIDGSYERTEGGGEIADIYRAMLAAAPSAQADSGAAGGQGDKP